MNAFRKYKYLLVDVDDTVLDFNRCQHDALASVLTEIGIEPTEEIISVYDRINIAQWKQLELGLLDKKTLVRRRYELFLKEIGSDADPSEVNGAYEEALGGFCYYLPGAEEALKKLAEKYKICIITNGLENVQKKRLGDSGIADIADYVFISGKIGYNKPSKEFFDWVAKSLPDFDTGDCLVVGDSLTSDIRGGLNYGIDTCWVNIKSEKLPDDSGIKYVVDSFAKVPELLELSELGDAFSELVAAVSREGIRYKKDLELSKNSSFKIGGKADLSIYPSTPDELCRTLALVSALKIRYKVVGNTTDLLFDDRGFRGVLIFSTSLKKLEVNGTDMVVEAGLPMATVCKAALEHGLSGLEFAYGIPGTLGGAVYMNAGAYGGQISDVCKSVTVVDSVTGEISVLTAEDMRFSYRHSLPAENGRLIVAEAVLSLSKGEKAEISAKMEDFMNRRKTKQPLEFPSAGSVFKRPAPDIFVGKLIEDAGLKGRKIGGAQVSEKHAGFIINAGGATSADVNALIALIQKEIYERNDVKIECEIIRVPETE